MIKFKSNTEFLAVGLSEIEKIEGLEKGGKLKVISLNYNKIKKIEGLEALVELEWLSLEGNKIKKIEGLEGLGNLRNLNLAKNKIRKIENIETLPNSYIDLRGNPLKEITASSLAFLWANKVYINMDGNLNDLKVVD